MRKKLTILFLIILSTAFALALSACEFGGRTNRRNLIGTWEIVRVRYEYRNEVEDITPGSRHWHNYSGFLFTFNEDNTFIVGDGNSVSDRGNWHLNGNTLSLRVHSYWGDDDVINVRINISRGVLSMIFEERNDGRMTYFFTQEGPGSYTPYNPNANNPAMPLAAPSNFRITNYGQPALTWDEVAQADRYTVQLRPAGSAEFIYSNTSWNNWFSIRWDFRYNLREGINTFRVQAHAGWWSGNPHAYTAFSYLDVVVESRVTLPAPQNLRISENNWGEVIWDFTDNRTNHFVYLGRGGEFVRYSEEWGNGAWFDWSGMPAGAVSIRVRAVGEMVYENGVLVLPSSPFSYLNFDLSFVNIPLAPPDVAVMSASPFHINLFLGRHDNGNNFLWAVRRAGSNTFTANSNGWNNRTDNLNVTRGINTIRIQLTTDWRNTATFVDGVFTTHTNSEWVYVDVEIGANGQIVNVWVDGELVIEYPDETDE